MVSRMAPAVLLAVSLCLPLAAAAQVMPAAPPRHLSRCPPAARRRCRSTRHWRWPAAHAPAIRAAEARAAAEAGAADASRAWRSPTLDLSIENLGPQDLDHDALRLVHPAARHRSPPLHPHRRRTGVARSPRAARWTLRAVVVDLAVVETYLAVVRARQATALLAAHERAIDEVVRAGRRRVGEGVAPEGDLRKLEAERARTTIARVRADLEQRHQALTLGVLIGQSPTRRSPIASCCRRRRPLTRRRRRARPSSGGPTCAPPWRRVEERRTAAAAERALGSTAIAAMGGYKRTSGFNTGTAGVSIDLPIGLRNTPARLRAEAEVTAATLELEQARALGPRSTSTRRCSRPGC